MRKRSQYKKPKFQNKIPTLVIMIVMLVLILCFGKTFSKGVAGFFAPSSPVTDTPEVAAPDSPGNDGDVVPKKAGTVISNVNKNAAEKMLPILSGAESNH